MIIQGILVSVLTPFENHMANGGEKLLGNASSIKRRPDGRVYVSGQMQRHVLFSAIDRLNQDDPDKGDTFVSNGDGVSNLIEKDLRADMGGFMHPSKGDYSGRRTSPLSVTPAVAEEESRIGRDLLLRIKEDMSATAKDQAIATREFSEADNMRMNFFLDITSLSLAKTFKYEKEFHIETITHKFAIEAERKRRVRLFLNATRMMNDYANQARNAVCGEPQKVLIVFAPSLSRKASRYFSANENERKNILKELAQREAIYFLGDDTEVENMSVADAYAAALRYLEENELYCANISDDEVTTFQKVFENNSSKPVKAEKGKTNKKIEELNLGI